MLQSVPHPRSEGKSSPSLQILRQHIRRETCDVPLKKRLVKSPPVQARDPRTHIARRMGSVNKS
jgi:hypothetical protein